MSKLVPHDVVDLEITEEGIRALTEGSILFSNFTNYYDNFMEYASMVRRIRRQLVGNNINKEYTVLIGKVWILDKERKTTKIKDSIQADLCKVFFTHKVSYDNNIFYVAGSIFQEGADKQVVTAQFRQDLSAGIRKIANKIDPEETICYTFMSQSKTGGDNYEAFFEDLAYVAAVPDDYCDYSSEPVEEVVVPDMTKFQQHEEAIDKDESRTILYKKIVALLVFIAGLLVAAIAFLTVWLNY